MPLDPQARAVLDMLAALGTPPLGSVPVAEARAAQAARPLPPGAPVAAVEHRRIPAQRSHPHVSPLYATDLSGLPPALIITSEFDPLCDEGEAYAEKLRQAGVPVTLTCYAGTIHNFFVLFYVIDKGREAVRQSAEALGAAFAHQPA